MLFEDGWLNSDAMDFFMLIFARNTLQTMHGITSFDCGRFDKIAAFKKKKQSDKFEQQQQQQQQQQFISEVSIDIVLMTINWSNKHWGLLGYYSVSRLFFWYEPANHKAIIYDLISFLCR